MLPTLRINALLWNSAANMFFFSPLCVAEVARERIFIDFIGFNALLVFMTFIAILFVTFMSFVFFIAVLVFAAVITTCVDNLG